MFVYGCNNDSSPSNRYTERLFPYLLAQNAKNLFNFKKCQFAVQKQKLGTGRVAMWKTYKILQSFTLEASFCGSNESKVDPFQYRISDLTCMGRHVVGSLYQLLLVNDDCHDPSCQDYQQALMHKQRLKKLFDQNSDQTFTDYRFPSLI